MAVSYYTTGSASTPGPRGILDDSTGSPYGVISGRYGRVMREVFNTIALLDANNTALLTLTRKLRKKPTSQMKFEWFEDEFPAQTVTSLQGSDSTLTDTTIVVKSGEGVLGRPGDLWLNGDSGEVFYIDAVSTDTWTIIRGIGSTTADDIATTDNLYYIGNAQDQGARARDMLATQTQNVFNYAQLFKEMYEVANDTKASSLYGGPDLVYLRQKHGKIHNRDIERMMWFGVRDDLKASQGTSITNEVYTSRGLLADGTNGFLTTNSSTSNSSGDYTEDEFDTDLITAFRYGGAVKFMFCSPVALGNVSSWGRAALQVVPRDKTFGINVTRYISPHGELNLINNKLFQDFSGAGTVWGAGLDYDSAAVILDLENIYYRVHRDTVLEMNIQENDRDSTEEQYLTRCGLEVHNEETCMDIYGFRNV